MSLLGLVHHDGVHLGLLALPRVLNLVLLHLVAQLLDGLHQLLALAILLLQLLAHTIKFLDLCLQLILLPLNLQLCPKIINSILQLLILMFEMLQMHFIVADGLLLLPND